MCVKLSDATVVTLPWRKEALSSQKTVMYCKIIFAAHFHVAVIVIAIHEEI